MNSDNNSQRNALLVLGCPEVPVQMAIALYLTYKLTGDGYTVLNAGNTAVLKLLKVSDPAGHYLERMTTLEHVIEEISEGKYEPDLCITFAHSDAGIAYASTMRYLLPKSRFITLVFGREAPAVAELIEYKAEIITEVAVHNPGPLKKRLDETFKWSPQSSQ